MSDRALWNLEAMAASMGAKRAGPLPAAVSGLSIDSRTIERGEAFLAIRGENRDGHEFVTAALARGAALAVVAEPRRAAMPALISASSSSVISRAARNARRRASSQSLSDCFDMSAYVAILSYPQAYHLDPFAAARSQVNCSHTSAMRVTA